MTYQPAELKLTRSEESGVKRLLEMLTWCRPDGSKEEQAWVEKFIDPLATHKNVAASRVDDAGNRWFIVGDDSTTMFTAHTDTVHHEAGRQQVVMTDGLIRLHKDSPSSCLGADDAAGCWLLSRMIQAGVPGVYVFFRGEERGGVGSRWVADNLGDRLKAVQRCISFDRKSTWSVITHQGYGGRCCSDTFAQALADQLCDDVLMYAPDDSGVFTDSANFTHIIPECTNLSVGYENEHTPDEVLDAYHLVRLARQLVKVNWKDLPTERDPSVRGDLDYLDDWRDYGVGGPSFRTPVGCLSAHEIDAMDYNTLLDLVEDADPVEVTELIFNLTYEVLHPRYNQ